MELQTLDVNGYKNKKVPNTFFVQPTPTDHVGIILPGYRHSADMADLNYAGRILREQNADLLRIEYAYYQTDFPKKSDTERRQWVAEDISAVANAALASREYTKITLIGKSLGTMAMGFLLEDRRFQAAKCVWLTPPLTEEWLSSQIEKYRPDSLFIIGTADKYYKPEILNRLVNFTGGKSLIIEGAHHGLEISESIPKSLTALNQIVSALQDFLSG